MQFALEVVGEVADSRYRSAVGSLLRPLSSGTQTYSTRKEEWPLTQPIPKLESMVQCTGEAKYISDAMEDKMLHAAFVLTTEGNATIYRIDATEALVSIVTLHYSGIVYCCVIVVQSVFWSATIQLRAMCIEIFEKSYYKSDSPHNRRPEKKGGISGLIQKFIFMVYVGWYRRNIRI